MIIFLTISLLICIFLHEAAHLIVAKKVGCGVEKFSIGFGKPILFKKKIKGIIYQITPWILGGYCQLKGELNSCEDKDAFINLPYLKKFFILIAGCGINIISGFLSIFIYCLTLNHIYADFALISIILGLSNLIPIIPCLDGGYILFLPLCMHFWGKEKGLKIFALINHISFIIVIILNIACIPYLIKMIISREL
jgi:membrane-associated protease RseP (regulator of RpoE activity)